MCKQDFNILGEQFAGFLPLHLKGVMGQPFNYEAI